MKLYKIYQETNNNYDTYDSAIVVAESEEDAKTIHPNGSECHESSKLYDSWVAKSDVFVEEIGIPNEKQERGVILASFNAG